MLITLTLLFATVLAISIVRPEINPGILALAFVFLLLPLLPSEKNFNPAQLFPTSLFLTLLGVTLFFSCVHVTGLIELLLKRILQRTGKHPKATPVVLFALISALTATGLGNIGTVALIAPLALPLAKELGISAFSMTLLVVGAANASSFSPLTLPGILTNDFIQKSIHISHPDSALPFRWLLFWGVLISISTVTFISFKLTKKMEKRRGKDITASAVPDSSETKWVAPPLTPEQKRTALVCLALAGLFAAANIMTLPTLSLVMTESSAAVVRRLSDVGSTGWLGSACMLILLRSRFETALKHVPWSTIVLVCGMSTFIEMITRAGMPAALSGLVQQTVSPFWMGATFAAGSGLLSAFTSSVGVALPTFLPLVDAVAGTLDTATQKALLLAVAAGSHLVDASPLSTLGALCLAQITNEKLQATVYRQLLIYSFCMIPVAALCALLFKILI